MNVLVIENEKPAAERLIRLMKKLDRTINVTGITETVEGTVNWLQKNDKPDLIMMDIQLDDGLCFEVFEIIKIDIPVIFTTAYDEYTLKAFKVNSVDYLLKPVSEDQLNEALNKFRKIFLQDRKTIPDFENVIREFAGQYKSRFLVKIGEKYRSVPVGEIKYFHIIERSVFMKDLNGKDYAVDHSLEKLGNILDPDKFFRINRDCIVSINSISTMYSYSSSRLQLSLENEEKNDKFVISRDRVADFKKWIDK